MNKKKAPPKKVVAKTAPPRKDPIQYLVIDEEDDKFEFVQAISSEDAVQKFSKHMDPDEDVEVLVVPGYAIEKFRAHSTRVVTRVGKVSK